MDDNSITEYEQSFENWRFLVGLRFTVLAFSLTLTSALLYAIFTLPLFREKIFQYLVSIIGIVSSWAIIMLEGRNRQLYYSCIRRAKEIECQNGTQNQDKKQHMNGLAHEMDSAPVKFTAWHTGAMYTLYGIMLLIWIALLIVTMCGRFPAPPVALK